MDRLDGLEEVEGCWRLIFDRAPGSFFQRFEPSLHWARVFATGGRIYLWRNSRDTALAVFTLQEKKLALLGQGLFDYLDLVGEASPEEQRQLANALLDWNQWDEFEAIGVPADSRFWYFWEALQAKQTVFSASPLLLDSNGFEQQHRRATRRFQQQIQAGWEVRRIQSSRERQTHLQWILDQKAQAMQADGHCNVLDQSAAQWLREMVEHQPALAELWQLHRAGETAAGLLTWRSGPVRYAYTISYSPEAAAISPGVLLLYGVLRHSITEGLQFDFLTGEQPFKLRFADARRGLLHLCMLRRHKAPAKEWMTYDESGTEDRVR